MSSPAVQIGFAGRFFPDTWRPAPAQIAFAARAGFAALQFQRAPGGLTGEQLQAQGLVAVMELLLRVDARGRLADDRRPRMDN